MKSEENRFGKLHFPLSYQFFLFTILFSLLGDEIKDLKSIESDAFLFFYLFFFISYLQALLAFGGPKWTRTTDLTLIRRAL